MPLSSSAAKIKSVTRGGVDTPDRGCVGVRFAVDAHQHVHFPVAHSVNSVVPAVHSVLRLRGGLEPRLARAALYRP